MKEITLVNDKEARKLNLERIIDGFGPGIEMKVLFRCLLPVFKLKQTIRMRKLSLGLFKGFTSSSDSRKFDFDYFSETILNGIFERLESKELQLPFTFDSEYSQGVLTVKFNPQTVYVLNNQPPNQQIWLSSPFSGPRRFEWKESDSTWRDVRNSETELIQFLKLELSEQLKFEL